MVAGILKSLLFAASLLLCGLATECWILRLTCKIEADFDIVVKDFILENHVIGKHTTTNHVNCVHECVKNRNCKSLNHNEAGGEDNCELNGNIKDKAESDFKPKSGWVYHSTNYKTSKIGSVCQEIGPCAKDQYCVDTCDQRGFKCFSCEKFKEVRLEPFCQYKHAPNIAFKKPASLSSQYGNHWGKHAVDGSGICAQTNSQEFVWWKVDLGARALVLQVSVATAQDAINIRAGDNDSQGGKFNPYCARSVTLDYPHAKNFTCKPNTFARYVSIDAQNRNLMLCDVRVYGIFI